MYTKRRRNRSPVFVTHSRTLMVIMYLFDLFVKTLPVKIKAIGKRILSIILEQLEYSEPKTIIHYLTKRRLQKHRYHDQITYEQIHRFRR